MCACAFACICCAARRLTLVYFLVFSSACVHVSAQVLVVQQIAKAGEMASEGLEAQDSVATCMLELLALNDKLAGVLGKYEEMAMDISRLSHTQLSPTGRILPDRAASLRNQASCSPKRRNSSPRMGSPLWGLFDPRGAEWQERSIPDGSLESLGSRASGMVSPERSVTDGGRSNVPLAAPAMQVDSEEEEEAGAGVSVHEHDADLVAGSDETEEEQLCRAVAESLQMGQKSPHSEGQPIQEMLGAKGRS